jgi:putative membrane protein
VTDWQRLHPLTPVLRGYRLLGVLVVALTQESVRSLSARTAGYLLLGAIPFVGLVGYLSWRFTRYTVADGVLRLETGVLFRRSRQVPLARLQAVDVVRPLFARALGLAELRLEVVGRGKSEAPLSYLSEANAHLLRGRLLAMAAGVAEDTPEPTELVLVQVPGGVLAVSIALGGPAITGTLLLIAVAVLAVVRTDLLLPVVVPMFPLLLGTGGLAVRRFLTEFGFTVANSPDGLRLRHGLLETRAQTIPAGRVQAVRVVEPLLWRHFGWVRVEVDVAGYAGRHAGGQEARAATSALLPVAPKRLATAVLGQVLAGVDLDRLPTSPPPPRARWRAPLMYRNLGVAWDERHAVTTYGRVRHVTDVVPNEKVQSLRLVQGPWQRRLRLATLHLDTAGRDVRAAAAHRDATEAAALFERGIALTRAARAVESAARSGGPGGVPPVGGVQLQRQPETL